MRITVPPEHRDNPFMYISVSDNFSSDITRGAKDFQLATYKAKKFTLREYEAARARTAQINGCHTCNSFRAWRDLVSTEQGLTYRHGEKVPQPGPAPNEAFYENLANWRNYSEYSERERLAAAYAEGLGQDPYGIADDETFWKRAKAVFTDEELVELSFCIAGWMGLGRIAHALGVDAIPAGSPAQHRAA